MKRVRMGIVLVLACIAIHGYSQTYVFRVLASKGSNEIKNGETWQPVKTGASLAMGDELKISENASIGLVHSTGKPLEEKKPGVYKVEDLASRVQGESSVLNKYADFMLSNNSAEEKKNRLNATGAAHRGVGIKVFLPEAKQAFVYNKQLYLNWDNHEKGPYTVMLQNMFSETLLKQETPENSIVIDLSNPKLANEEELIVEITSATTGAKTDQRYAIKWIPAAEKAKVAAEIAELSNSTSLDSELGKLYLASLFEQHKLYVDAIGAYEQAIKMDPTNPTYKEYYEEFLLRNRLKVEVK